MKSTLFTILLLLTFLTTNFAQIIQPHPCGTPSFKSEWLKRYQQNPTAFAGALRTDTVLYAPITLHVVGTDAGFGYIDLMQLTEGLCDLNQDFVEAKIHYFVEGDIRFIDSSDWYEHNTVLEGADMMFDNNVNHTINCYVVADPAGNLGYNLPYAGIALNKGAASGGTNHTWAHEVGHNLSIQHPFLGWEGNPYNYNQPTPTTVVYDYTYFKDTLIRDTTILDTALVELVDGSNCTIAADGFCDTPPDYLAGGGWPCNAQGQSITLQKDPNDVDFRSDGTNIMSYASDVCVTGFTPEQMAAMRANLTTEKPTYLYNQNPLRDTITTVATLDGPTQGETVQYNNLQLSWSAVPGATHYIVQVSRFNSFPVLDVNTATSDTTLVVTNLLPNLNYKWRVKAINPGYTCSPISPIENFNTANMVTTKGIKGVETVKIYPTLLENGQLIQIEMTAQQATSAQLLIYNMTGQLLQSETIEIQNGDNNFTMPTKNLVAGNYVLTIQSENGQITERIVVY